MKLYQTITLSVLARAYASKEVQDGSTTSKTGSLRGLQQDDVTLYNSLWHDVATYPEGLRNIVNFAVEIPLTIRAKMELQKTQPGNPISQDHFEDGEPRFYSYGDPFFN